MNWQINSIVAFQHTNGLTGLMQVFTYLGREEFFLMLIPLVYFCFDTRTAIRLGVLLLLGDALNFMAKLAFHAPRPYWVDAHVRPLATETSYGLPSSHAQNALSIWLFLALLLKKPWAWAIATCLILLVSISRVYLGVHFWTDIFGGWLIGLFFLILFQRLWPDAEKLFCRSELHVQILASLGLSLLVLFIGMGVHARVSSTSDPAAWASYSSQAHSLQALFSRCGALMGLGIGWALSLRWATIEPSDSIGRRLVRFVIGVFGVFICWKGLQISIPSQFENVELLLRFFRYGLISLWITFLAPWLFLKFNLAEKKSRSTIIKPVRARTSRAENP